MQYCATCWQAAYCDTNCLAAHAKEHSLNCTPITAEQAAELSGVNGYLEVEDEAVEEIAARGRSGGPGRGPGGGGGFRPGRSPTRVSPTRISPTRGPRGGSPTRFGPGRYGPGRARPFWNPSRRYPRGFVPPYWSLVPPLWQPYYRNWYARGGTILDLTGLTGVPPLPAWTWVDDPAAVEAQLAYLNSRYSYPGAYIAPDPATRRFVWVRADY